MANTRSARKRIRQNITRRMRNTSQRSRLRTYIKYVLRAVTEKDVTRAKENFRLLEPMLDRAVMRGLFHRNKAARYKRRLNQKIRVLTIAA